MLIQNMEQMRGATAALLVVLLAPRPPRCVFAVSNTLLDATMGAEGSCWPGNAFSSLAVITRVFAHASL